MNTTQVRSDAAVKLQPSQKLDMKLEVIVIPVTNVDRAKQFYGDLGWRIDADIVVGDFHAVQFTPPGSPCSIHFGTGITTAAPGSATGMYLVVSDVVAARAELLAHDVDVSEIFHRTGPGTPAVPGVHPQRGSYFSYASFSDPDGNSWLLQEVTSRFPGRVSSDDTTFTSSSELAAALRRAEAAHIQHEKRTGERDANWPEWYAEYLVNESGGKPLPN